MEELDKSDKMFLDYLKKVSPGTPLRTVLDDIIRAGRGTTIVLDCPELTTIIEGGFKINCRFTPQKLFELCKMDGAIVVSSDLKKILYSNVLLIPDPSVYTSETGTRHKSAERTAKQANTFVIAVSERKRKTTLYFSKIRYYLRSLDELLRETTNNLQILEKQREIFDELVIKLNILEMSDLVSCGDVCKVLQRTEMILKISEVIKRNFTEMGKEGVILNMRFKELIKGVEKSKESILRDYANLSLKRVDSLISNLTFEGLSDLDSISRLVFEKSLEDSVSCKGYRFLSKLNLNEKEIFQLVNNFKSLNNLFMASQEDLDMVFKNRGEDLKKEIDNLREQVLSGKTIC
jgi:diadenylate cyclase